MTAGTFEFLIIGNSAGGIGCIEGIRRGDRKGRIAVVSEELHHVYSRPLITHLIAGDVPEEGMDFRPRDFYREHDVKRFPGFRATEVNPGERTVRVSPVEGGPGQVLKYRKLLIATGAAPFMPPLDGLRKSPNLNTGHTVIIGVPVGLFANQNLEQPVRNRPPLENGLTFSQEPVFN